MTKIQCHQHAETPKPDVLVVRTKGGRLKPIQYWIKSSAQNYSILQKMYFSLYQSFLSAVCTL